jgi:hypothetical protein
MDFRAQAVSDYLLKGVLPNSSCPSIAPASKILFLRTDLPLAGEANAVRARYVNRDGDLAGFISLFHGGLEHTIQWTTRPDLEKEVEEIVESFKFEEGNQPSPNTPAAAHGAKPTVKAEECKVSFNDAKAILDPLYKQYVHHGRPLSPEQQAQVKSHEDGLRRCVELFDAARTAAAELGRDADAAIALHETGVVFLLLGDFSKSREMIELALRGLLHVYDASQNPRLLLDLGMFCLHLGDVECSLDDHQEAQRSYRRAKKFFRRGGYKEYAQIAADLADPGYTTALQKHIAKLPIHWRLPIYGRLPIHWVAALALCVILLCYFFFTAIFRNNGQSLLGGLSSWFAARPTMLVTSDLDCEWALDGKPQGFLRTGHPALVPVGLGSHLVEAKTLDSTDEVKVAMVQFPSLEQHVHAIGLQEIRNKRLAEKQAAVAAGATANSTETRQSVLEAAKHVADETQRRGYWIDASTGLMWTARDNGADIAQPKAAAYCRGLTTAGFRDWHLPSIDELAGIYDANITSGNVRGRALHTRGGIQLTDWWVWSGTSSGSGGTWPLYFTSWLDSDPPGQLRRVRALCVRHSGE